MDFKEMVKQPVQQINALKTRIAELEEESRRKDRELAMVLTREAKLLEALHDSRKSDSRGSIHHRRAKTAQLMQKMRQKALRNAKKTENARPGHCSSRSCSQITVGATSGAKSGPENSLHGLASRLSILPDKDLHFLRTIFLKRCSEDGEGCNKLVIKEPSSSVFEPECARMACEHVSSMSISLSESSAMMVSPPTPEPGLAIGMDELREEMFSPPVSDMGLASYGLHELRRDETWFDDGIFSPNSEMRQDTCRSLEEMRLFSPGQASLEYYEEEDLSDSGTLPQNDHRRPLLLDAGSE